MKKQIAIYLRLSLEDVDKRTNKAKDESNSISAQRMLITRHLDQNPTLKDLPRIEFCDDGYSGTNFERPAFQKMIEMVKKGEISCIVVKDLSRFGRDYIEVGDYLEHIFPFLGIRIKAINDHYDSDKYLGRTSGMDVAFKNLIYDYYSKDLSKKVRSGMGVKQKQGRYVNCVLYGYKRSASEKHQMVIDEVTAPVVRRVFNDIICGKSTTEVAKSLNDEHIPTPAQYKGTQRGHANDLEKAPRWTHNRILEMIRNIKYTGTMVNHTRESRYIRDKNQRRVPQDEWVVRENAHEAIVSQEEYQAAQDAIRKVKGYSRTPHDTSDCVFYCGHCGHKLRKTFGSDTYFSCSSAVYQEYSKCSEIKFGKTEIEDVIFSALKAQVSLLAVQTKCTSEKLICESFSLRKTLERLQTDIDGIDREKFNRYEDYHAGEISAEAFLDEKERLNLRQSALKEELSKTQLRYDKCVQQEESTHDERMTAKKLTLISDDELRVRMYALIDKITVYANDDITISWKFDAAFADEKNTAGSIA